MVGDIFSDQSTKRAQDTKARDDEALALYLLSILQQSHIMNILRRTQNLVMRFVELTGYYLVFPAATDQYKVSYILWLFCKSPVARLEPVCRQRALQNNRIARTKTRDGERLIS